MASFNPTTTNEQRLVFTPEARQALGQDIGFYGNLIQPQQQASMAQLLSMLQQGAPTQARAMSPGYSGLFNTLQIPGAATQHAANARGLQTPDLTQAIEHLRTNAPQLLDLLRQAALKSAQGTNSLVDPRWADLLKPNLLTLPPSTSPGSLNTATQGLGTALQLAGLIAGFF